MNALVETALHGFASRIGIPFGQAFQSEDMQFRLDSGALLGLCVREDALLVTWAERVREDVVGAVTAAMTRAANVGSVEVAVQVGLRTSQGEDWLVLGRRLDLSSLDENSIYVAAQYLKCWREPA